MKICLVIIFNHRFDKNIAKLRKIYEKRFSYIKFIVPFYNGKDEDVIAVYESSYQFQGYIAQSYDTLMEVDCDSYFFIADDSILTPECSERSMVDLFEKNVNYISSYAPLSRAGSWGKKRCIEACPCFYQAHTNYKTELLDADTAFRLISKRGFDISDFTVQASFLISRRLIGAAVDIKRFLLKKGKVKLPYPLMGGYSDLFIISKNDLKEISRAMGVMAAMGIFVEVAIPTCMCLYSDKLKTFESIGYKGGAVWGENIEKFEEKYGYLLENLMHNFPDGQLYCHPVKLSKWK